MDIRPSLRIGGHDPATEAGKRAFLKLTACRQADYLHRIDYLEADVRSLLQALSPDRQAEVLGHVDADECWRSCGRCRVTTRPSN